MSMHVDSRPTTQFGEQWWYRHVCAVGAVLNMFAMLAANLVGFVIGTGGISYMIGQLTDSWEGKRDQSGGILPTELSSPNPISPSGIRFVLLACFCLFVAVQILFEYRYVRS